MSNRYKNEEKLRIDFEKCLQYLITNACVADWWIEEIKERELALLEKLEKELKKKRYVHSNGDPVIDWDEIVEVINQVKNKKL